MLDLLIILKYKRVWLNIILCFLTGILSFIVFEISALFFVLLSNVFDILGYHFTLIRRTNQIPDKIIVKSYRVNQFLFDALLLLLIGIQFSWVASIAGWIVKLFGLQDIFYYLFLNEKLPLKWNWMRWTPLGWFKGDLTKNEIVIQSIVGILIAMILLTIK
ncbi:MAG: hypothetical protein WAU11_01230 [Ignavibacteriaceae bacterium]